ncbi:hypothetical protein BDM02DRAFT_3131246 [Thelephora ganbajun]|uniref:Uncharacterized protein n=1 Tax=Thelephora ganbajun TaxID=370292 RepID=A0ACB6Z624_THEGA|nr:hypothetical protein BDM02DRAFT_3131246 [Thelephora ganbajun]
MYLPEELLDEISGHLPPDGRRSLRNCSLVAKSWLQPSRRLLFARVFIRPATNQSWLDNISPMNTGLLYHVRSLKYLIGGGGTTDSRCGVYALRDYLLSFFRLQRLALCHTNIGPTICEHPEWFSAFQHTLSSLSLTQVSTTWSVFIALVGYFPNLRDLDIFRTLFQVDDLPVPPLPHALRGRLSITFRDVMAFPIDRLCGLKPEYEELEMYGACETRLVTAVEWSLKHLTVDRIYPEPTPSLSRCPELRQLEIATAYPQEQKWTLISSITSTNLRKLVFSRLISRPRQSILEDPCWIPLDDIACGLVDRLQASGYKRILELEFRGDFAGLGDKVQYLTEALLVQLDLPVNPAPGGERSLIGDSCWHLLDDMLCELVERLSVPDLWSEIDRTEKTFPALMNEDLIHQLGEEEPFRAIHIATDEPTKTHASHTSMSTATRNTRLPMSPTSSPSGIQLATEFRS